MIFCKIHKSVTLLRHVKYCYVILRRRLRNFCWSYILVGSLMDKKKKKKLVTVLPLYFWLFGSSEIIILIFRRSPPVILIASNIIETRSIANARFSAPRTTPQKLTTSSKRSSASGETPSSVSLVWVLRPVLTPCYTTYRLRATTAFPSSISPTWSTLRSWSQWIPSRGSTFPLVTMTTQHRWPYQSLPFWLRWPSWILGRRLAWWDTQLVFKGVHGYPRTPDHCCPK